MAKLTLSFLLLFFVIAFSESSTPSDLPKEDVSGGDLPRSTLTILLPSEKPQSDAAAAVLIDPVTTATDSKSQDQAAVPIAVAVAEDRPASEPEKITSVPLRTVTFRPDDHGAFLERMVPLSLRFPSRHGGRGCHHGHRQFRPRFPGREISYGNDMILSESGPDPESRGIERQIAGRWIRVHHRKPRFGFVDVAWKEDEGMMKRPDRHEEHEVEDEREHHHRRWKEDEAMMKKPDHHEEREDEEEREHHHRRWKEDEDMMKRPRHEEHEDEEEREHHHRRWKEDMDMMKRPDRHEEREDDEEREHHHRRWKEDKDMMKRPHRPEDREDEEEGEHHHRHHHHHFRHHHDHEEEEEEEERHGGEGIYKRIRKFLNHF